MTTAATHTQGPWVINGTNICGQAPQMPGRDADQYPDGTFMVAESVFNDANARLIAAAPDMLEALQNARGLLDTPIARRKYADNFLYKAAIKAIRKALQVAA